MLAYWLLFLVFATGALTYSVNASRVPAMAANRPPPQPPKPGIPAAPGAMAQSAPPPRRSNRLLFAAVTITALLIGLRYEVGTDWDNYLDIFDRIGRKDLLGGFSVSDPAYAAINSLAHALDADIWLVNLICGALLMFGVLRFARLQPNPWLAVAVAVPYLLLVVGMGYSRQAVAIGLGMAGLAAVARGSFLRFAMWVLAAALFHRTAVVLLPLVAIAYSRNRFQTVVIALVGVLIGYYVLTRSEGIEQFNRLYISRAYASEGAGIRLAMNVPPALIYLLQSRRLANNEIERGLWRTFAVVGLLSFALWPFVPSSAPLDRLALYIIPLQLFVLSRLPRAFARRGGESGLLVLAVLLYSAAVQFVWLNFATNAVNWIPYQLYPIRW